MKTAEKTFLTTDGQEVAPAQIERIYGWARDKVCEEGKVTREEVHAWYTETDRHLIYRDFTFVLTDGHSMFGGEDLGIWRGSHQGSRENALFFAYRQGTGPCHVSRLFSLDAWLPELDDDITKWEKEQAALAAQAAADAVDMSLRRQEAAEWLSADRAIARIGWAPSSSRYFPPAWELDLKRHQQEGLLPAEETWELGRVIEANLGGLMCYIHPIHPDYSRWLALTLGSSPNFELVDEPCSHILPPLARFLRFK